MHGASALLCVVVCANVAGRLDDARDLCIYHREEYELSETSSLFLLKTRDEERSKQYISFDYIGMMCGWCVVDALHSNDAQKMGCAPSGIYIYIFNQRSAAARNAL